jgi:hypothetical protein
VQRTPHAVQQFLAAHDTAALAHEVGQQIERRPAQGHQHTGASQLESLRVEIVARELVDGHAASPAIASRAAPVGTPDTLPAIHPMEESDISPDSCQVFTVRS